jgi:hypothetical protein
MSLNQLIENQVREAGEAVSPVESTTPTIEQLKELEVSKLQTNLAETGVQNASPSVLNMVISGLLIGIPAYMGMGYLLDHLPFVLSQGSHTMVRLGAMFGMRPLINKLTKFTNDTFVAPASNKLKSMASDKLITPVQSQIKAQALRLPNSNALVAFDNALKPQPLQNSV